MNINRPLKTDNVFIQAELRDMTELTGLKAASARSKAIVAEGEILNVVSNQYGFLANEDYFLKVEEALIMADVEYVTSSKNVKNRRFSVDYILGEPMTISNGDDVMAMMSFYNSYDCSSKTTGSFALYRKICSNGLHVATQTVDFSVKHRGQTATMVIPKIKTLIDTFLATEYRELQEKAMTLSKRKVSDIDQMVQEICENTKVFKYDNKQGTTEQAKQVMRIAMAEADVLDQEMNSWLVYNAFNEVLHEQNHRNFDVANEKDMKIFEAVMAY